MIIRNSLWCSNEKPEYLFQEVLDLEGIEFGIEIEFESEMSENDIIKCLEKRFSFEKNDF